MFTAGKKLATVAALVVAATLVGQGAASASSITYTESAVATGTIGATAFSNAALTISWTGDTANVTGGGGFFINVAGSGVVSLTIAGVGSTVLTDNMEVFVNQGFPAVGFGLVSGNSLLDTIDAAFSTYDLTTFIGPVSNTAFIRPDLTFGTGLGGLNIASVQRNVSTFTASGPTATAVPEPMTLSLVGIGLAVVIRRRLTSR